MTNDCVDGMGEKFAAFQSTLRDRYGETVFKSWMSDLTVDDVNEAEEVVTLSTPSRIKADRLNQQYRRTMLMVWCEKIAPVKTLSIRARQNLSVNASRAASSASTTSAPTASKDKFFGGANGFAARAEKPARQEETGPSLDDILSQVDTRLQFDAFAVDATNMLAYAAAQRAIFDNAGGEVIYIYGPSGSGKTHLLHAIANAWNAKHPGEGCAYFTYSDMRDVFGTAARSNKLHSLHRRLHERDLVLIDDIHLLKTCARTQEEILNLANALPIKGRQLVIAGEQSPEGLKELGLNDRLTGRLAGGLPAPIEPGNDELRREVLMKRRAMFSGQCVITDEAIEFVAVHFPRSIREAIGAFNQLALVYRDKAIEVGVEEARVALKAHLRDRRKRATMRDLLDAAAEAFELTPEDLQGRAQPQRIAKARHAFVMVGRESLRESFPQLAGMLNRDHTTAMSSYDRAQALYDRDEKFRNNIAAMRAALGL